MKTVEQNIKERLEELGYVDVSVEHDYREHLRNITASRGGMKYEGQYPEAFGVNALFRFADGLL